MTDSAYLVRIDGSGVVMPGPVFTQMSGRNTQSGLVMVGSDSCPACISVKPILEAAAHQDAEATYGLGTIEDVGRTLGEAGVVIPHIPYFLAVDSDGRVLSPVLESAHGVTTHVLRSAARYGAAHLLGGLTITRKPVTGLNISV